MFQQNDSAKEQRLEASIASGTVKPKALNSGFPQRLRMDLADAWQNNRFLVIQVAFSLVCLVISVCATTVDHRLINGEHAWIKPCKFASSLAIYGLSLICFSQYLTKHKSLFRRMSRAALGATLIELPAIMLQVVRGTTSHFNTATAFDRGIWVTITLAILPIAFGVFALFVMLLREKNLPAVLGLSLKWGVFLTLIGMIPGIMMLLPEIVRGFIFSAGQFDGHTIGVAGGPGLPFFGWSTVAGDLRVAHFTGIHGLQVLPLFGLLLDRFCVCISDLKKRLLVWNAGFTFLGLVGILTWQALCAESVAAPSGRTIAVALILVSFSALGAACTLWLPEMRTRSVAAAARVFRVEKELV